MTDRRLQTYVMAFEYVDPVEGRAKNLKESCSPPK